MGPCPSHELDMNLSSRARKYSQGCKRGKALRSSLLEDFPEEMTLRQDSEQGPSRQGDPAGRGPHAALSGLGKLG